MEKRDIAFKRLFPTIQLSDKPIVAFEWPELQARKKELVGVANRYLDKLEKAGEDYQPTDGEREAVRMVEDMIANIDHELNVRLESGNKGPRTIRIGGNGKTRNAEKNEGEFRSGETGLKWEQLFDTREGFGEYEDREHFYKCLLTGQHPESRTMTVGSLQAGGATVPAEMAKEIYNAALERAVFLPYVRVFKMGSSTLSIPAWKSEDRSLGGVASVAGSWTAEDGTFTAVTPQTRAVLLTAKKLGVYVDVTRECFSDSLALSQMLGPLMTANLSYSLDAAIYDGTGVGQPLGVLRCPGRIEVSRASAGSIAWADILSMYSKLHPAFIPTARWYCSPSTLPKLLAIADSGNNSIWVANASPSVPASLFGIPVSVNEHSKALGTCGDLCLLALSEFAWGLRQEIIVETTNAPGWYNDRVGFRAIVRCDGHLLHDEPITTASGDELSSVVVLAA